MSDDASQLNADGAQELLREAPLMRLAYAGRDGLPRVVPIGFLWDGGRIVVCTAASAPKVGALLERPDVALTIDAGATPAEARQLLVRGIAEVEVVDGVPDEYLEAASKTMDGDGLEQFSVAVRGMYEQMARISIMPRWARFYDFGAGNLPPFLLKLAGGAA